MWLTYDYRLLSNIISLFPCVLYLLQTHHFLPLRVTPLPWPSACTFLWARGWRGRPGSEGSCVPVSSWVSLVRPPAQGCRAIGWSPGGRCLLLFLDCCTWPLNWGKLRDLLFPQLCDEIVNSSMQGKRFCFACYNAEYGGWGCLSMTRHACFSSNTNSK